MKHVLVSAVLVIVHVAAATLLVHSRPPAGTPTQDSFLKLRGGLSQGPPSEDGDSSWHLQMVEALMELDTEIASLMSNQSQHEALLHFLQTDEGRMAVASFHQQVM